MSLLEPIFLLIIRFRRKLFWNGVSSLLRGIRWSILVPYLSKVPFRVWLLILLLGFRDDRLSHRWTYCTSSSLLPICGWVVVWAELLGVFEWRRPFLDGRGDAVPKLEFLFSYLSAIAYDQGGSFVVSTFSDGLIVCSQAATFQGRRLFTLNAAGVLESSCIFFGAFGGMSFVLSRFIHVEHLAEYVSRLFARVPIFCFARYQQRNRAHVCRGDRGVLSVPFSLFLGLYSPASCWWTWFTP